MILNLIAKVRRRTRKERSSIHSRVTRDHISVEKHEQQQLAEFSIVAVDTMPNYNSVTIDVYYVYSR